jgi:hypothetical protein
VLAGRSDLTKVSLSAAENNGWRTLKVTATAPVKLVPLGDVVDGTADVAVLIAPPPANPPPHYVQALPLPVAAMKAVLHLDDTNRPRVNVSVDKTVEPSRKGWQLQSEKNCAMAARGLDNKLLVVARVEPHVKGVRLCRHGNEVYVEPQEQPSGPALPVYKGEGNVVYRLVSAIIDYSSDEAANVRFGPASIEIPTDQAPDNFAPDLRYGLRVLQPPQQ